MYLFCLLVDRFPNLGYAMKNIKFDKLYKINKKWVKMQINLKNSLYKL